MERLINIGCMSKANLAWAVLLAFASAPSGCLAETNPYDGHAVDSAVAARYQIIDKYSELRAALYRRRDYTQIEKILSEKFQIPLTEEHSNALEALYKVLADTRNDVDSETMAAVLNDWCRT